MCIRRAGALALAVVMILGGPLSLSGPVAAAATGISGFSLGYPRL